MLIELIQSSALFNLRRQKITSIWLVVDIVLSSNLILDIKLLRCCGLGEDGRGRAGEDEAEVDAEGGDG